MNWEMWGAVLALATLIATLGLAILAQGRATRRGNQDALKSLGKDVNNRFEGMKAVLDQMDAKNEHAHAAITTRVDGVTARVDGVTTQVENLAGRVDRLTAKVDVVAHDVAFLAGRQAERADTRRCRQGAAWRCSPRSWPGPARRQSWRRAAPAP